MKKYFFMALAAVATLTACQQGEEPQTVVQTREISFAPAATETRATPVDETVIDDLETNGFAVWGWVRETTKSTENYQPLFSNILVSQTEVTNESDFSTSAAVKIWQPATNEVKYWAPASTYYFSAFYPREETQTPKYSFSVDKDGKTTQTITDFTLAENGVNTTDIVVARPVSVVIGSGSGEFEITRPAVGLTFDHMLSRVRFSFTNTFDDADITIKITNVKLHNVINTASAVVVGTNNDGYSNATWTAKQDVAKTTIFFQDQQGDVLSITNEDKLVPDQTPADTDTDVDYTQYRLLIPENDATYKLTFDLEVLADGVTVLTKSYSELIDTDSKTENNAITLNSNSYLSGKSYHFNANISGNLLTSEIYPIQFDVKVTDWASDYTVDDDIMR